MNRGLSGPILKGAGLKKAFVKGSQCINALNGVDVSIGEGEMVAVMGASGAGKSTLLHVLGTLEPPSAGRVTFGRDQQDLYRYSDVKLSEFRNRTLGFIFQFHYLLPEFSALENVMMPALIAGHPKGAASKQAVELLKFVGLSHRLAHRPTEMSGGEQQRVAIARSVVLRPKLILADEPTGNLDTENSEMVMDLLGKLNQQTGVSVLFVTHNAQLGSRMNRVIQMRDGRIVN